MDLDEWQQVSARLVGLFPQASLQPETFAAYFDELRSYDADVVETAIRLHSRESKWFPTIAELLERIIPEHQVRREWDHLDFSHAALPSGSDASDGRLLPEGRDDA